MKFNLKSFIHKEKSVSLSSLHKKDINPGRDWVVMLGVFSGFIVLSIIISLSLSLSVFNANDPATSGSNTTKTTSYTNVASLQSAVDYINSRSSN